MSGIKHFSLLSLCQGYVVEGGPCRRWLPLFDVKHIFHILLIKSGKNLLLSKKSHIALVLPSLDKEIIKKTENKMYNFIWKGPDKVVTPPPRNPEGGGGVTFLE